MKNLKSIAKATGVSVRTVTRALYGNGEISPATREKIVRYCEKVDYTPNFAARSLKLKRTDIIGLIRFYLNVDIDNKRITLITEELAKAGYDILQGISREAGEEKRLIREFKQKCDGLIIYARPGQDDSFKFLKDEGYPFVLMDPGAGLAAEYPSVSLDREAGITEAIQSLGRSGKKNIAFVTPFREYPNRFPGFKAGLESLGIPFSRDRVMEIPTRLSPSRPGEPANASMIEEMMHGGYQTALNHPAVGRDVDALFCFDDRVALGCLRGLFERGIRVPEQVAVVGFDDADYGGFTHVPLSTVRQPVEAMAHAAVSALLDQVAGRPCESRQFQTAFIKRLSS